MSPSGACPPRLLFGSVLNGLQHKHSESNCRKATVKGRLIAVEQLQDEMMYLCRERMSVQRRACKAGLAVGTRGMRIK